jgi:hypothetical protein
MLVFRVLVDNSELWKYTCDIDRANSLNTKKAIMCDKEVLKSHATNMLNISLQRISNVVTSSYLSVHSIVKLLSDC